MTRDLGTDTRLRRLCGFVRDTPGVRTKMHSHGRVPRRALPRAQVCRSEVGNSVYHSDLDEAPFGRE
jgi:hypothetical protein